MYLVGILTEYLDALEAARTHAAVVATTAPHARRDDYRALIRRLDARTRPLMPRQEPQRHEHIAHDPEQAAAWFAAQGMRVVRSP